MSRHKIAILVSWYPSRRSPIVGRFMVEQAEAIAEQHDVALVAPVRTWWRDLWRGLPGRLPVGRAGRVPVFARRWIAPFPRCPQRLTHGRAVGALRGAFEELLERWGRPDLVHAHVVLPAGYAAAQILAEHRIPFVLSEHSGPLAMHLQSPGERRMSQQAFRQAARVMAVSPALREQITDFEPGLRVDVTGNLIRTRFFTPSAESKDPAARFRFFTACGLVPEKGLAHLLQAAGELAARGRRDFEIRIAGDGLLREPLMRQAGELGLARHCTFLGWLSPEQVRDELRRCDVFVSSSLHETFGIAIGEAMACGRPVLATRSGGAEYLVTAETGVLVDAGEPGAMATAMVRFLDRQSQFESQAIRASVARRFGEESFAENLTAIYDDVLREGTS